MNKLQKIWERFFPPVLKLPAGVFHRQLPSDSDLPYRLHLRIDPDGRSIMIVNASTVVHLNQTATEYAYHLVQATPDEQAVEEISRRYNVRREIVLRDYHDVIGRLRTLVETPDLDPVTYLDFDRDEPYSGAKLAPYRLDCALTYRLMEAGAGHLAPQDRVSRELTTEEWRTVIEKAWKAGIPHVVFTGGEPTLRPDLAELVAFGENLGMVTGLITNGLRLAESKYLHELLQAGLDHVMILLDPLEDQCWECIRDALAEDIAVTVHLTLAERSLPQIDALLDRLAEMGVKNVSLSADDTNLKEALREKRRGLAERHIRLIWDMPVPYSHFHPVAVELAETIPDVDMVAIGQGQAWLYVEPDGDVLRGQGYYQEVLGNLLLDPWEVIWQRAKQARQQKTV